MFHFKPGKIPLETKREVSRILEEEHGIDPADYPHTKVAEAKIETTTTSDRSKPFRTSEIQEVTPLVGLQSREQELAVR
jgi:coenzyme F420-reducing hydrogenase beta subunit